MSQQLKDALYVIKANLRRCGSRVVYLHDGVEAPPYAAVLVGKEGMDLLDALAEHDAWDEMEHDHLSGDEDE